jgi:hypothetical protein
MQLTSMRQAARTRVDAFISTPKPPIDPIPSSLGIPIFFRSRSTPPRPLVLTPQLCQTFALRGTILTRDQQDDPCGESRTWYVGVGRGAG